VSLCVDDEVGDVVAAVGDCDVVVDVDSDMEFVEVEAEAAGIEAEVAIVEEVEIKAAN
jgi:hypothetical protein